VESSRLAEIITNSDKVPVGNITDNFEKQIKEFFSDSDNQKTIASELLNNQNAEGRLRVPSKVRESIISSILENFASLTRTEILAIPTLIKRLPQTMMSSDQEDALFEKFLEQVSKNIVPDMTKEELTEMITNIAKLHIKHPCKDEPIVRFFDRLGQADLSSSSCVIILSAASVLSQQKLAHATVRSSLVTLVNRVEKNHRFDIIRSLAKLPVFPEADTLLDDVGDIPSSSESLASGCLGLLTIRGGEKLFPRISEKISTEIIISVLENVVVETRVNRAVANLILERLGQEESLFKSSRAMAGYVKLVSVVNGDEKNLAWMFPAIAEIKEGSCDLSSALWLARAVGETDRVTWFKKHIQPKLAEISARQIRISSPESWVAERSVKHVEQISDALATAELLVKTDKGSVADHLCKLIHKHQKEEQLLEKIWIVLTQNGTSFPPSDSARKRALKEVTKTMFRAVRMAPVSSG
jgi:hypothetical protein